MKPITEVTVKLIGEDGNAFSIIGKVKKELKRSGYDNTFIEKFIDEATSGDYDHLLKTVMKYVYLE